MLCSDVVRKHYWSPQILIYLFFIFSKSWSSVYIVNIDFFKYSLIMNI